jgi:predicted secreted protein
MAVVAGTLQNSMGTQLLKGATPVAVAHIHQIKGLDLSASTIDTTALDTTGGYKTFIASTKEAGDVSIQGFFNGTDHQALYNDFKNGASDTYKLQFPDGSNWTFTALVTAFKTDAQVGNAVGFDCTLKVSGQPTFSLT